MAGDSGSPQRDEALAVSVASRVVLMAGMLLVGSCRPTEQAPAVEPDGAPPPLPVTSMSPLGAPGQGVSVECIRGGTTRAEVVAVMGEPDSVVFGAWMYGRSSITFGYGTVLDFSDDGGNLILC